MAQYDPKTRVNVSKITKRGEHYTVSGTVDGRPTTAHIPAPTLESRKSGADQALIRRTLLGTHLNRDQHE